MRTIDADQGLKDRIITDFRAAMAELRCIGSERLVRIGVSMSQLHVMSMLDRHGDMPMSRLAEMIDVSLSNATGLVDRMEERGFVERVRVPDDRRVVLVRITKAGRRILDEVEVLRAETLRAVLDRLDPDQLDGIARATADLRDALAAVAATPGATDHDHTTDRRRT
ncbi:MAG: MarR family transcriptional regulator [Chloroflexota bacterium]|nr:MarR family transcriptional regulator [Chloroflexota bacterium]